MIERENVNFIEGTGAALRVYSVEEYIPHYHGDCLEILFLLEGEADILSSYDSFHLVKGDFTVINEGDVHCIRNGADNVIVSLYIDLNEFTEQNQYVKYLYFICESFNANSMQEKYCFEIRRLITEAVLETAKPDADAGMIRDLIRGIMDILIGKFDLVYYHNGREIPDNQMQRYYRIVKEIEEHYGEKLELEDLAQREFIGKTYISQFWKKMTNMNFTEYLNSRRTEKAERILLSGDKSITEISLRCGFSDPKYIYKSFKKWYDTTPSRHKKKYEKYVSEGNRIEEYDRLELMERLGRSLAYANIDEERASLIRSAEHNTGNWRRRYENQMSRYSGSKLKREMIKESHHELGLREIYLPLLDRSTTEIVDGTVSLDDGFILSVLHKAREMAHVLYIELEFDLHSADDWEAIIRESVDTVTRDGGRELLQRCRYVVCFDELEKDVAVKELIDRVSPFVGAKNIKMALKFQ